MYNQYYMNGGAYEKLYFTIAYYIYIPWYGRNCGFRTFKKKPDIFVRFPSIICLPISIVVLNNCAGYIEFRFIDAVGSVVAIIAMMVNLRLAHKLMDFYNKKLNLYNL